MRAAVRAVAVVGAAALLSLGLPQAARADVYPQWTVSVPASVSAVSTAVGVSVAVAAPGTDPSTVDLPASVELFDGTDSLGSQLCPVSGAPLSDADLVCTVSFTWDTWAAALGTHTLHATLTTQSAATTDSGDTSVDVSRPAPTVSFSAPASGATVTGSTSVVVDGATSVDGEFPTSITVTAQDPVSHATVQNVGTVTCPGDTADCPGSVSWDSTALDDGDYTLAATVTTSQSRTSGATRPVTVSNPPVVTIDSPAASSTVSGVVSISVTGTTTAPAEYPTSIAVKVDGTTVGTVPCSGSTTPCTGSVTWNTFGATQTSHSLSAVLSTSAGRTDTQSTSVTVSNTAPTVGITAPTAGATVTGSTDVLVSAATHVTGESPSSIDVSLVGGADLGTVSCDTSTSTCSGKVTWPSLGTPDGGYTLRAVVTTTQSRTASQDVAVTVSNPVPTVSIDSPLDGGQVTGSTTIHVSAATSVPGESPTSIVVAVGGTTLGTVTCGPLNSSPTSCSGTVPWDATLLDPSQTISAHLSTTTTRTADASATVDVVSPAPTVAITTPVASDTVSGLVQVSIRSATDLRLSEQPTAVTLSVDGTQVASAPVDVNTCNATATELVCTQSLSWDATGVTGSRALSAGVTTSRSRTAASADVVVSVVAPPATVAITTPAADSVVKGTTSVTVTTTTDASQLDYPAVVSLYLDGVLRSTWGCPGVGTRTCTHTFLWGTSKLAGPHRLTARVVTTRSVSVFTPQRRVWVWSLGAMRLTSMPVASTGALVTLHGRVLASNTGKGVAGVAVRLVRTTSLGTRATATVFTRSDGSFAYSFRAAVRTTVAASAAARWLGATAGYRVQSVRAPISCSPTSFTLRSGATGSGSCYVPRLPSGTPVSLYYTYNRVTRLLASGSAPGSTIPFRFRFLPRGTYVLRVVVGANKHYVTTTGPAITVSVR